MKLTNNPQIKPVISFISKDWFVLLTIISLATFLILWKLGQGSLSDWDEAIHAQVAKEFIQSGDWLTPHWNYEPYFRKPPLSMWLTATFFSLFGVNEFWARATSALSGIGLVIVTYLMAQFIYGRYVGCLTILILLTSYEFLYKSRFGTTDVLLTCLIFIAVYAYLRLREGGQKWWYLIWISFALAFMVKGVGAIVIPSLITLSILLDRNWLIALRSQIFWHGFLLALLIVAPWHIFMVVKHGMAFIDDYLGFQVIARINRPIEGNTGDLFYYVWVLKEYFFPWFYLVPFAVAINLKENLKSSHASRILLVLFCLVFGGYSLLVKTKLGWYIFPVYPLLAILIASMLKKAIKSPPSAFVFSGLIIGVVLVALTLGMKKVLIIVGLSLLAILIYLAANKKLNYQLTSIVICAIFMLVGLRQVKPLYYKKETPIAKLGYMAGSQDSSHSKSLIVLKSHAPALSEPALLFYSNRPVTLVESLEDLAKYTKDSETHEVMITQKHMENLGKNYEFKVISKVKPLVYGIIQQKYSP
jgi:4-amino-4-deoxy-L-arabinose transferase-like glycosyltransferase